MHLLDKTTTLYVHTFDVNTYTYHIIYTCVCVSYIEGMYICTCVFRMQRGGVCTYVFSLESCMCFLTRWLYAHRCVIPIGWYICVYVYPTWKMSHISSASPSSTELEQCSYVLHKHIRFHASMKLYSCMTTTLSRS